jgi:hypothetical protein
VVTRPGGTRLANLPPSLTGMEACVWAHHLSRTLQMLGHDGWRSAGHRETAFPRSLRSARAKPGKAQNGPMISGIPRKQTFDLRVNEYTP